MTDTQIEKAECRNCGIELVGTPYYMGGHAYHIGTMEVCDVSFWGGYVCSDTCNREIDRKMKRSIDDHADPNGYYRAKARGNQ